MHLHPRSHATGVGTNPRLRWDSSVGSLSDDVFADVAAMSGVADAVAAARSAMDPVLLNRKLREHGRALAAQAALQNAHASAALEGSEVPIAELSAGAAASPVLRVALGVLEVQSMLRRLQELPARQIWAQLAVVAGREYLPEDLRGRPRQPGQPLHDPLHLKGVPEPDAVSVRLAMLAELLQRPTLAPAMVVAAIAHAELVATQPFAAGNGVIARAYFHHVLADRGVDPDYFSMTDVGLLSLGRAAYVRAIQQYDQGADGVAAWVLHVAQSFERGALLTRTSLDSME